MLRTLPRLARSSFAILEVKSCKIAAAPISFTFEACGENKIQFVDHVEDYLKTELGHSQNSLEEYWEIEEDEKKGFFSSKTPGLRVIHLHELLEWVEDLDIPEGQYKLKGATTVGPQMTQYIFATED